MTVPDYIAQRIRTPYPDVPCVLRGSTPVVSFGDFRTAHVATLGINPSDSEFVHKGEWLVGDKQRFATLRSLGLSAPEEASDADVAAIVHACCHYFQSTNPYWKWFRPLDKLIQDGLGVSYETGTAIHLDLVQWATSPVWRGITKAQKEQLIGSDREFLREQLARENIELVVMNGRSVMDQVERAGLRYSQRIPLVNAKSKKSELVFGRLDGTAFLGWSQNVQSLSFTAEQQAQVLTLLRGIDSL